MKVHLGGEPVFDHLDTPLDETELLAAVDRTTYWNPDSRYDGGWERAGGESFLRRGYASREAYEQGEAPVCIEKSGNPEKTYRRGTRLEEAGADIIPTCMVIDDGADPETDRLKGGDYRIFQAWTPEPFAAAYENRATERQGERSSPLRIRYSDREAAGVLTDAGVASFGRTSAAIDAEGFRIKTGEGMIKEFLTDGNTCYVVDFGADLGTWGEPHTRMQEAAHTFLLPDDRDLFDEAYTAARTAAER